MSENVDVDFESFFAHTLILEYACSDETILDIFFFINMRGLRANHKTRMSLKAMKQ